MPKDKEGDKYVWTLLAVKSEQSQGEERKFRTLFAIFGSKLEITGSLYHKALGQLIHLPTDG